MCAISHWGREGILPERLLGSSRNSRCLHCVVFVFHRKKSGKLKASYKRDCFSLGSNVDIDFSGPTIDGWAVLAFEGWLAGYQMSFDTAKSKLSQNNFALGYKAADFQLHTHV